MSDKGKGKQRATENNADSGPATWSFSGIGETSEQSRAPTVEDVDEFNAGAQKESINETQAKTDGSEKPTGTSEYVQAGSSSQRQTQADNTSSRPRQERESMETNGTHHQQQHDFAPRWSTGLFGDLDQAVRDSMAAYAPRGIFAVAVPIVSPYTAGDPFAGLGGGLFGGLDHTLNAGTGFDAGPYPTHFLPSPLEEPFAGTYITNPEEDPIRMYTTLNPNTITIPETLNELSRVYNIINPLPHEEALRQRLLALLFERFEAHVERFEGMDQIRRDREGLGLPLIADLWQMGADRSTQDLHLVRGGWGMFGGGHQARGGGGMRSDWGFDPSSLR